MKTIIKKSLPSGRIPFEQVTDAAVRSVLMRMNDNIVSLREQLTSAQKTIAELQRRT